MQLATSSATSLHINTTRVKRVINLNELAEVLAAVPEPVRRRMPLPILSTHLYGKAIEKPTLIEEVEEVIEYETARRQQQPAMRVSKHISA